MTIKEIKAYSPALPPLELLNKVTYQHNGKTDWEESNDINLGDRFKVIKELYLDYSDSDKAMIKFLLEQEIKYAQEEGDYSLGLNIISFMLYTIMDVTDIPLLYDAKFDTCYDAQCVLDIELIFGQDIRETKAYYKQHPDSERDVLGVIEAFENRPYKTRTEYLKFYKERRIPTLLLEEY